MRRGVSTIEPVVKVFVPLMWVFMLVLIVRGLTLPHGDEGVYLLFTPDFELHAATRRSGRARRARSSSA